MKKMEDFAKEKGVRLHYQLCVDSTRPLCRPLLDPPMMTADKKRVTCKACLHKIQKYA